MSKLLPGWGRNVRNRHLAASPRFYPERAHTLPNELPTGFAPRNPAPILDPVHLSTDKTALIIIIKEE